MKKISRNDAKFYSFLTVILGGVLIGFTILPMVATVDNDFLSSYLYKAVFNIWFISTLLTITVYISKIHECICKDK